MATASIVLRRLPQLEQQAALLEIIHGLRDGSNADIVLASAFLRELRDHDAEHELLSVLKAWIEQGRIEDVLLLSSQRKTMEPNLLECAIEYLTAFEGYLAEMHNETNANRNERINDVGDSSAPAATRIITAINYFDFCIKFFRAGACSEPKARHALSTISISLLRASNERLVLAARDLLLAFMGQGTNGIQQLSTSLWRRITRLISKGHRGFNETVGYQLWLYLLVGSSSDIAALFDDDDYSRLLAEGLRHGDVERRKLCLHILRRSVQAGLVPVESRLEHVGDEKVKWELLKVQYDRYCVVFETIILGRYINQIRDCRKDLDALMTSTAVVGAPWIRVLLASSLDPSMHEANRKLIGSWILESGLPLEAMPSAMAGLLVDSFLPWATQGFLFTSSARERDGQVHCLHGDALMEFVVRGLEPSANTGIGALAMIDALLVYLLQQRAVVFIYAAAYVLEGIARGFGFNSSLALSTAQVDKLLELSSWTRFYEITHDLAMIRICMLCEQGIRRSPEIETSLSSPAKLRLQRLRGFVSQLSSGPRVLGQHSTVDGDLSKRSVNEAEAIARVDDMISAANRPKDDGIDVEDISDRIQDLISDIEYLEYPKDLFLRLLPAVLDRKIVQAALKLRSESLTAAIARLVHEFYAATENRIYLLTPLMLSLRSIALHVPESFSFLPLEETFVRLAENPPQPKLEPLLEDAASELLYAASDGKLSYEDYYGKRKGVGFAAYIDLIARLGKLQPELVRRLMARSLERWLAQKLPIPTYSKWKTTLQLQTVLVLNELILADNDFMESQQLLSKLHKILIIEPLPRFRYLLEWMIARIYVKWGDLRDQILSLLNTTDHHSNPKYLASLMEIASRIACSSFSTETFAERFATLIVPLSASSKVIIRHQAQWAFPQLMDLARANKWESITANNAYAALDEYIHSLPHFGDPPLERVLSKLDLDTDHTLTNLIEGGYIALEPFEKPLASHKDLVELYQQDNGLQKLPAACMPLGEPLKMRSLNLVPTESSTGVKAEDAPTSGTINDKVEAAAALQTKGTAYLSTVISDSTPSSTDTDRNNLIVVASLIDNPFNLGGLSRVSEIFGASALYLEDPRVVSNKLFTSVSVSSHLHVPIEPLLASDTPTWLADKKSEGWTVVGIEQTDRSVLLGSEGARLPPKSILVLGSESNGIPASVLVRCDLLVEIPQQGITRSLNVQTAAAIVLFEYARQHRCGSQ